MKSEQLELFKSKIIPDFISEMEKTLQGTLSLWGYDNLDDYVKTKTDRQKTVEKTKLIGGFYENIFKKVCKEYGISINDSSEDGFDITIDDRKFEMKMTLSQGDAWTGNSYSKIKVEDYILIKLSFNNNNKVEKLFVSFLKAKNSKWSTGSSKNNSAFSNLHISKDDIGNLSVVYGSVKIKNGRSKYLCIEQNNYPPIPKSE
jgi:hypothetical protein